MKIRIESTIILAGFSQLGTTSKESHSEIRGSPARARWNGRPHRWRRSCMNHLRIHKNINMSVENA